MCLATMAVPVSYNYEARSIKKGVQVTKESSRRCSRKILPNANFSCGAPMKKEGSDLATCAQRPPVSSADDIRLRFLNRLGIQKSTPISVAPIKPSFSHRNTKDTEQDPTSDNDSHKDRSSSFSSCSSFGSSNGSRRSVSFDEQVTVRPIPRHDEYPCDIRTKIWADPHEIYENATRNSIEFAADNFDWQHAAEEDEFVPTLAGELVHPIHYARQFNIQRNFLLVMAARQQQHCR